MSTFWEWLVHRFQRARPSARTPDPVQAELQQLDQKIEVTQAAKAHAEEAAQVTGEYDEFRPIVAEKAARLRQLERQRQIILREHVRAEGGKVS